MSTAATTAVPVLPTAAEVRGVVAAVEAGLKLLKGLAQALERAERKAAAVVRAPAPADIAGEQPTSPNPVPSPEPSEA